MCDSKGNSPACVRRAAAVWQRTGMRQVRKSKSRWCGAPAGCLGAAVPVTKPALVWRVCCSPPCPRLAEQAVGQLWALPSLRALPQVTRWPLAPQGLPRLAGATLPAQRAAGRDAGSPPRTARTARGSHRAGGREWSGPEPTTAAELCFNFPREPRVYENVKIYCLTLPSG